MLRECKKYYCLYSTKSGQEIKVLEGFKTYANLPSLPELALYHRKTIEKQEKNRCFLNTAAA